MKLLLLGYNNYQQNCLSLQGMIVGLSFGDFNKEELLNSIQILSTGVLSLKWL